MNGQKQENHIHRRSSTADTRENKSRMATPTSPSVFDAPPSFNLKPAINAGPR